MHSPPRFFNVLLIFSSLVSTSACTQVVVSQETAIRNDAVSTPASQTGSTNIGEATTVTPDHPIPSSEVSSRPTIPPPTAASSALPPSTGIDGLEIHNLTDFQQRFEIEAKTPKGAIRMLFLALLTLEKNPTLAESMATVVYSGKKLTPQKGSPTGFVLGSSERFILNQLKQRPEIVHSYLGGTPEKDYMDFDATGNTLLYPPNGEVNNTLEGNAEGLIHIKSQGKTNPTPLFLERNAQGLFKIDPSSVSSIATGVKKSEPKDF